MKILLPYKKLNNVSIYSDDVTGGIEIFTKRILENLGHDIIVVEYTSEEAKRRLVVPRILEAVEKFSPDIIVANFATKTYTSNIADAIGIPIMWIFHSLGDTVQSITFAKEFESFRSKGHSIYMVSEYQLDTWRGMAKRNNISDCLAVDGFIDSAFNVFDDSYSKEKVFDVCTISRPTKGKDGYLMNRKYSKLKTDAPKTILVTSKPTKNQDSEYVEFSLNCGKFIDVRENISRSETIDILKKSKVYVSTSFRETWGITTLEALSYGIPVLACVDSKGNGPIHGIPASDDHYDTFRKTDNIDSILEKIEKLTNISDEKRSEIMESNREKHSKHTWCKKFNICLEKTIEKFKGTS